MTGVSQTGTQEHAVAGSFWAGGGMTVRVREVWVDGYSVEVVLRNGHRYKRRPKGFIPACDFTNGRLREVEDPTPATDEEQR